MWEFVFRKGSMEQKSITTIAAVIAGIFVATDAFAVIANPGFESGLSGWTVKGSNALTKVDTFAPATTSGLGNAFTTSNWKGLVPTEGTSFAMIANGDLTGKTSALTATQLSQTFTLGTLLKFNYDFMTDEINQPTTFNDAISVTLTSTSGTTIGSLLLNKVSLLHNGYIPNEGGLAGGSGWLTDLFDTTDYAGQTGTLTFAVWDVGESAFKSALAIDNLVVIGAAPIPEPGTVALGFGMIGVAVMS